VTGNTALLTYAFKNLNNYNMKSAGEAFSFAIGYWKNYISWNNQIMKI